MTPRPYTTCASGRCQNRSFRADGLCAKHATAAGKLRPSQPAEKARHLLTTLTTTGWNLTEISRATGISTAGLKLIRNGKTTHTHHHTITALKNLTIQNPADTPAQPG